MIKLNVGCGGKIFSKEEGWINVDAVGRDGVDAVMDFCVEDLPNVRTDHIQLQDFLEHLPQSRQDSFLKNCYDNLKVGGTLFIQVPDLEVIARRYLGVLENPTEIQHNLTTEQFCRAIYAGGSFFDLHKWGYDAQSLRSKLESIGFVIDHIGSDGGSNLLCYARK